MESSVQAVGMKEVDLASDLQVQMCLFSSVTDMVTHTGLLYISLLLFLPELEGSGKCPYCPWCFWLMINAKGLVVFTAAWEVKALKLRSWRVLCLLLKFN